MDTVNTARSFRSVRSLRITDDYKNSRINKNNMNKNQNLNNKKENENKNQTNKNNTIGYLNIITENINQSENPHTTHDRIKH
jgi:hypothetical protein